MIASLALLASAITNPLTTPGTFPIAVWLQSPSMASRYKAAGFNLYVGLWKGPTEEQLQALTKADMPVICDQNEIGLRHKADPVIVGWMHGDEPDNAQAIVDPKTGKQGWGPCIPPQRIVDGYKRIKAADTSRPVLLNLGQGVANDAWHGRGNGSSLDDYKTYVQGCDVVSFDVYPVAGVGKPDQLDLVAKGVDRLVGWTDGKKRIWNCLECTNIGGKAAPSPEQVRAEAWSAIIHGSTGLIYFVHQFEPKFNEHALLDDPKMLPAVTALNKEIQSLGPVLASKTVAGFSANDKRVHVFGKAKGDLVYVFAVSLAREEVSAELTVPRHPGMLQPLAGGPRISVAAGKAQVRFEPYQVRIFSFQDR
jgi:hypothetical protein